MNRQLRGNLPPNEKANGKNRFLSLLLLFMAFISVQVYAQDVKVSGTVIAEADKFPIIGANIVVKGTTIGTVTDIDGNFSLDVPQNSTIAISYIGCETQEIKITGAKTLNIVLKDNAIGLDDVVVIGYGSQRKSDLTGGIVAVGEEKLQMVTTNNLMDKLAGQIPGMNVTTSNAKPGEDQSLRVRGENSLSADNSPLIVMDGIPYSGSLGDIDPDIIENMSVLKDASSAAIYGSRGANGVILIQTKKGKKGAPTVSYKGQVGMQQAQHRIDMMKGADIDATNDKTNRNVFISTFAEIQFPIDGLSFRTNFGYNYRNNFVGSYYGRNTLSGKKVNGSASIENIHYYDYTWENLLKYNKTFGLHKIDATALFSMQETTKKEAKESGESFVNDDSEYHNMAGAEKNKEITSKLTETAMLSYMLRLNYSYANKYLLTLTGRSDGYSAFGKNNKYAFFPSVAAAWNISSEEFMESQTNYLDMLKIRLSWGSNGNQAINPYQTLDRLTLTNYIWGDNGTVVNGAYLPTNGVGNPNLRWETSRTINAGIDFSFFNGRLSGNIDMYVVNTSDLLMSRTVPYMNGYKSIMDNVGKTRNKGVEIALNSVNFQNNDFRWTTNVNFSLNRDKIIELRGDGKDDITNKWFIGEPLRVFYDYNVVGTWQENETYVENGHTISWDAESGKFLNEEGKEYQKGAVPGSAKLEDKDGNGSITADDKKIIGSKLPSFLLSMGNRFDYKNIYFSFLLNGVFGQTKELHDYNFDRWMPTYNYISGMDYWTPENPTNEMTSPAYVPYDKHSFYKKMNYVNIKNITIGYTFPKTTLSAIGISSLSINASVNNLYTFSNIDNWLNLEDSDANRNVLVTYPTARSYMFGLNLTF